METLFYSAYGLSIASDYHLPELTPIAAIADPDVRFEAVGNEFPAPAAVTCRIRRDAALLKWPYAGHFVLEAGRCVRIDTVPGMAPSSLRAILLGMVLSLVLYQRGFLVLHSSAVALRDETGEWGAIGFLGRSGEGKSTMAAALHARGHRMMSDDVIAVPILAPGKLPLNSHFQSYSASPQPDFSPIFPAYPQLRLWPQSVEALGEDAEALPRLNPQETKRARPVTQGFAIESVPLRALCVLESDDALNLQRLATAPSLIEIVTHSYCIGLQDPGEAAAQFQKCGVLAQTLPVFRLSRSRDLACLDEVAELVESQIATNWARNSSKTP